MAPRSRSRLLLASLAGLLVVCDRVGGRSIPPHGTRINQRRGCHAANEATPANSWVPVPLVSEQWARVAAGRFTVMMPLPRRGVVAWPSSLVVGERTRWNREVFVTPRRRHTTGERCRQEATAADSEGWATCQSGQAQKGRERTASLAELDGD